MLTLWCKNNIALQWYATTLLSSDVHATVAADLGLCWVALTNNQILNCGVSGQTRHSPYYKPNKACGYIALYSSEATVGGEMCTISILYIPSKKNVSYVQIICCISYNNNTWHYYYDTKMQTVAALNSGLLRLLLVKLNLCFCSDGFISKFQF